MQKHKLDFFFSQDEMTKMNIAVAGLNLYNV